MKVVKEIPEITVTRLVVLDFRPVGKITAKYKVIVEIDIPEPQEYKVEVKSTHCAIHNNHVPQFNPELLAEEALNKALLEIRERLEYETMFKSKRVEGYFMVYDLYNWYCPACMRYHSVNAEVHFIAELLEYKETPV